MELMNKKSKLLENSNIKFDIVIFLIPFLLLSFALYIYYPGIYTFDVFNQLSQIDKNLYTPGHPFISTFYIMIFYKLFKFKSALVIFQILWYCIIWVLICKYNRKNNDSKFNRRLQMIFSVFMGINPLILTTVISNNKDSVFFLIFMTICYFMQKIIDDKFDSQIKNYVGLSFFLIFFSNIRHNGHYTILVFIPIMLIVMIKYLYKNNKKKILVFCASLIVFTLLFKVPSQFFEVIRTSNNVSGVGSNKALQLEGYLYNNNYLSDKEIKTIKKYVSLKSLSERSWNYTFSDPITGVEKTKYYEKNSNKFIKDSIKIALNHKKGTIKFYLESSPLVWSPVLPDNSIKNYFWIDINVANRPDSYYYVNGHTKLHKFVSNSLYKSLGYKLLILLFYSCPMYLYMSIILTIYLTIKKRKFMWLMFLFNAINVLIISISIPVQDTRYLINNMGLTYILTIIAISVISQKSQKQKEQE